MRLLVIIWGLALLAGCASTDLVKVSHVNVDRDGLVLAEQGKEKSHKVMEKLADAVPAVAEAAFASGDPAVAAIVYGTKSALAAAEKGGDAGGQRVTVTVPKDTFGGAKISIDERNKVRTVEVMKTSKD